MHGDLLVAYCGPRGPHIPERPPRTASYVGFSDQSISRDERRLTRRLTDFTMAFITSFRPGWELNCGIHKATCTLSVSPFSERPRSIANDNYNYTKPVYRSDVRRRIYDFNK